MCNFWCEICSFYVLFCDMLWSRSVSAVVGIRASVSVQANHTVCQKLRGRVLIGRRGYFVRRAHGRPSLSTATIPTGDITPSSVSTIVIVWYVKWYYGSLFSTYRPLMCLKRSPSTCILYFITLSSPGITSEWWSWLAGKTVWSLCFTRTIYMSALEIKGVL